MVIGHAPPVHPHYHRKFYILMTTVLVGALLILMLFNDSNSSLTGSTVGLSLGDKAKTVTTTTTPTKPTPALSTIKFSMDFDTVPDVKEETTKFKSIALAFKDLKTKIKINDEQLELTGLSQANMDIESFKGKIDFDKTSLSLKGEAEKVKVNGVEISTKKTMKISFSGLVYNSLKLVGVQLNTLEFKEGQGKVSVKERMTYQVGYDDTTKVTNFKGAFSIGSNQSLVNLKGEVANVAVKGDINLNLS